jgi:hypothetical protein
MGLTSAHPEWTGRGLHIREGAFWFAVVQQAAAAHRCRPETQFRQSREKGLVA